MSLLLVLSLAFGTLQVAKSDKPLKEKGKDEAVMVTEEIGTTAANSVVPFSGTVLKYSRKEKRMKVWRKFGLYKNKKNIEYYDE